VDNAHALHPNHPEKSDITNKTVLGGGIVIKSHANGSYVTEGVAEALIKTIFDNAGVTHQPFFNRSDVRSGSTLGRFALTRMGVLGADIGLAQLAMHSSYETAGSADADHLVNAMKVFYQSRLSSKKDGDYQLLAQ
jgi:aspartyl aminopeptidase